MDEEQHAVLAREAERTGKPIAELIREAVDARYGLDHRAQDTAYATVLAAPPMPVEEWAGMKGDMLDTFYGASSTTRSGR